MSRISEVSEDDFIAAYRGAPTLRQLAEELGQAPSTVSARAARLRARGVDLEPFGAGRSAVLAQVLQVTRWAWVVDPSLRAVHRRRLGASVTLCNQALLQPSDVHEEHPGKRCAACWPVGEHPPTIGAVPAPRAGLPPEIIAETAAGVARLLRLDLTWQRWIDVETGEDHAGKVRAKRWWPVHARRTCAPCGGR